MVFKSGNITQKFVSLEHSMGVYKLNYKDDSFFSKKNSVISKSTSSYQSISNHIRKRILLIIEPKPEPEPQKNDTKFRFAIHLRVHTTLSSQKAITFYDYFGKKIIAFYD